MKKIYALLAGVLCTMTVSAQDMYLIGTFNNWTLADASAQMEQVSEGVYTKHMAELLPGWKINDGTWDNPDLNIGSNAAVSINGTFTFDAGASSGNINFSDADMALNIDITLDLNAGTITLKGEAGELELEWYLAGSMNGWAPWDSGEDKFTKVDDNIMFIDNMAFTGESIEFKVTTANWVKNYGMGEDSTPLAMGSFTTGALVENSSINIPCSLSGTWDMVFDFEALTLTAMEEFDSVESIAADNAKAEYFNLQGVRVNNPEKGLYIVRMGNKVTKAYIF